MLSNKTTNEEIKETSEEYLSLECVFGLSQQCRNSFGFLTESEFIYLTGSNLLKFDINNFKQKLIKFKSRGKFKCMNVSSNKHYVLFVNSDQNASNLLLIDLKQESVKSNIKCRRKIPNSIVKCIAVSANMELIVCQSDADSNWNLSVYSYLRLNKLADIHPISNLYSNEQTVEDISFLPNENKKFILIGHKLIKIFQYVSNNRIKTVCNIECMVFLEKHCWFSKTELITYDKYSSFFLIDPKQGIIKPINFQVKNNLTLSYSTSYSENIETNKSSQLYLNNIKRKLKLNATLLSVSDGFILSNLTENVMYYKFDCLNNFTLAYVIRLPRLAVKEFISNIYINDSKAVLIASTNRSIIYFFCLKNLSADRLNEFELLIENYHSDSITSFDMCVRKSWIVSCSLDRTVIIWNYETKSIDLRHYFDQDLLSVAFHPSGLYLIVCTTSSLKYMKICLDSLAVVHSLNVRNCTNCLFANGGHIFAFVQGTIVQIYSSLDFIELGSIKTQEMGKIKQLRFTSNDNYLICCSMAGMIKIWHTNTLNLSNEIISKGLSYVGLALHPSQENLYLISTEKAIREYQLTLNEDLKLVYKINAPAKLVRKLEANLSENLTSIEISKSGKMLCVGTNKGVLKVYLLPTGQCREYRAHSSSLNRICIAYNDEVVVTGSDDGTIGFWQIFDEFKFKNVSLNCLISSKTQYNAMYLEQDIVLTNRKEYFEKSKKILEIQRKIDLLNNETEFDLRLRELKFKIKAKELKSKFDNQINLLKEQINAILLDQEKHEKNFNHEYETRVAQHLKDIQNLHESLNFKIETEKKINSNLSEKINGIEKENDKNRKEINQVKNDTLLKQYEKVEIHLKLTNNNHLKQVKKLENDMNNLIDYEYVFEEELELEKYKLNLDARIKLEAVKSENENLNKQLADLQQELKAQQEILAETSKEAEKKNKDYYDYLRKIEDLDTLDAELREDFERKNEKISDMKELNELEFAIKNLESLNESNDNFITDEINNRVEPLKLDNKHIKQCVDEIKSEIKENKTNIFKIINEIDSIKNIYKVKCDELANLNKMTSEKHLTCKNLIKNMKKLAKEAHFKIHNN